MHHGYHLVVECEFEVFSTLQDCSDSKISAASLEASVNEINLASDYSPRCGAIVRSTTGGTSTESWIRLRNSCTGSWKESSSESKRF